MKNEQEAKREAVIYNRKDKTYELKNNAGERIVLLTEDQARHVYYAFNSDKTPDAEGRYDGYPEGAGKMEKWKG